MELDRKAFHFDLDNKSVERFYTGKKNPWSDIQDFLESHCFENAVIVRYIRKHEIPYFRAPQEQV